MPITAKLMSKMNPRAEQDMEALLPIFKEIIIGNDYTWYLSDMDNYANGNLH